MPRTRHRVMRHHRRMVRGAVRESEDWLASQDTASQAIKQAAPLSAASSSDSFSPHVLTTVVLNAISDTRSQDLGSTWMGDKFILQSGISSAIKDKKQQRVRTRETRIVYMRCQTSILQPRKQHHPTSTTCNIAPPVKRGRQS